jgi:hypothetical protein
MHNGRMDETMQQTYEELKSAANKVGLSFNVNKIKILVESRCDMHI